MYLRGDLLFLAEILPAECKPIAVANALAIHCAYVLGIFQAITRLVFHMSAKAGQIMP